jgi:hypothetical protein
MLYSKQIYSIPNVCRTRLPLLDIDREVHQIRVHSMAKFHRWLILIHFNDYILYNLFINVT